MGSLRSVGKSLSIGLDPLACPAGMSHCAPVLYFLPGYLYEHTTRSSLGWTYWPGFLELVRTMTCGRSSESSVSGNVASYSLYCAALPGARTSFDQLAWALPVIVWYVFPISTFRFGLCDV